MSGQKCKEKVLGAVPESMQATHLLSTAPTRRTVCICLYLQVYVVKELAKGSSILKEYRQARKERTLAKPQKG